MRNLFLPDLGLWNLPLLTDRETRSVSGENPDGRKGGGARHVPEPDNYASELGRGWKARPCITLPARTETTLADLAGPGIIQHIWLTVDPRRFRSFILRMYWDGEDEPSVETPLGDFFACTHGQRCRVNSLPVAVNPTGGCNAYWPMPFARHARVTLENPLPKDVGWFYYQITYALGEVPDEAGRFHAQWRRAETRTELPEHVILEGVRGHGHYVGTVLAWTQRTDCWWGEGEVKFFLDGDEEYPTICGTGTEDYFGGAWGLAETFCAPFTGYPYWDKESVHPRHGLYRWHLPDPIHFRRNLRVTIQTLGFRPGEKFIPLADDVASLALWYQDEPHHRFPAMPPLETRLA
ncbi:MAG: glycoside hydrolase family 172 protein [Bacteroidota bacterium]